MGKEILKILGIQLGIFLLLQLFMYIIMVNLTSYRNFLLLELELILVHLLLTTVFMIVSFARRKDGYGIGFLISMICLFIVGLGSCANLWNAH
jgi:hypothetical protein